MNNIIRIPEKFFIDRGGDFKYFSGAAEIIHSSFGRGAYIAGGAVRRACMGEEPSDYDVFFTSADKYKEAKKLFIPAENNLDQFYVNKLSWIYKYETQFAESYKLLTDHDVQLIRIQYGLPGEIFRSFHITACQWAYDYETKEVITTVPALVDSYNRRIVMEKVTYPVATLQHLLKYIENGFTFCRGAQKEFLTQVKALPIETFDVKYID